MAAGEDKLVGFLVGKVMRSGGGKADPKIVDRLVQRADESVTAFRGRSCSTATACFVDPEPHSVVSPAHGARAARPPCNWGRHRALHRFRIPPHPSGLGPARPTSRAGSVLAPARSSRLFADSFRRAVCIDFGDAVDTLAASERRAVPRWWRRRVPACGLNLTLNSAGLAHRFSASVAGDEVSNGKPAPDVWPPCRPPARYRPGELRRHRGLPRSARNRQWRLMRTIEIVRRAQDRYVITAAGCGSGRRCVRGMCSGFEFPVVGTRQRAMGNEQWAITGPRVSCVSSPRFASGVPEGEEWN